MQFRGCVDLDARVDRAAAIEKDLAIRFCYVRILAVISSLRSAGIPRQNSSNKYWMGTGRATEQGSVVAAVTACEDFATYTSTLIQ